jgi:hypothetical protein
MIDVGFRYLFRREVSARLDGGETGARSVSAFDAAVAPPGAPVVGGSLDRGKPERRGPAEAAVLDVVV